MNRRILAVITSAINDRVVVGEKELAETINDHFPTLLKPEYSLLELIALILQDPEMIFLEIENEYKCYHIYYRSKNGRYFVVVVKKVSIGFFFSSVYETGKKPRNVHQKLERIY